MHVIVFLFAWFDCFSVTRTTCEIYQTATQYVALHSDVYDIAFIGLWYNGNNSNRFGDLWPLCIGFEWQQTELNH